MKNTILTGNIWEDVNAITAQHTSPKMVAISYVTVNNLNLSNGDILICDASKESISSGQTSAKALLHYLEQGVHIYSCNSLHCKFLVSENYLISGSANLSSHSANCLIESAIYTEDIHLTKDYIQYFHKIQSISVALHEHEIRALMNISIKSKDPIPYELTDRLLLEQKIFHLHPSDNDFIITELALKNNDMKEYIYIEFKENSVCAEYKFKKHITDPEQIKIWKLVIGKTVYIYAKSVEVDNLPAHHAKAAKDETPTTKMTVKVLCDENREALEDPRKVAEEKLKSIYYIFD